MPDRTDIDALLIGALYGELTPADEALLAAHLESHPADRTALADLTHTRAAVRDSRILAVQLEPPQAISALLLQEASRRAPRPSARDRETASWFQRFVRSFVVHPAMAAAAMLVLVVGVAGTLYLRGTEQFAESAPPALPQASGAASAEAQRPEVPANATLPTGTAALAPEPGGAPAGDQAGTAAAGSGAVAGSAGYRVDLDDAKARLAALQQDQLAKAGEVKAKVADRVAEQAQAPAAPAHAAPPAADPTVPMAPRDTRGDKPTKSDKKLAGIVVQSPELSPRELKETEDDATDRARRQSSGGDGDVVATTGRSTRGAGANASGGAPPPPPPASVAAAPAAVALEQAGAQPAPAFEPGAPARASNGAKRGAKNEANNDVESEAKSEAKIAAKKPVDKPAPAVRPPQRAPAAAPSAPNDSNRFAKSAGPAAKDTAGDRSLIDWARKRHEQVKTLVSSNNCRAAASAATEIYSRAPDYYAANVVTDRTIKPCLSYLNTEREREDRVRAAKNAAADSATESAAPAPPPARK